MTAKNYDSKTRKVGETRSGEPVFGQNFDSKKRATNEKPAAVSMSWTIDCGPTVSKTTWQKLADAKEDQEKNFRAYELALRKHERSTLKMKMLEAQLAFELAKE